MATQIDLLQVIAYNALVGPHADPKALRGVPKPKRLPRPGEPVREPKRQATPNEMKRFMAGIGR